METTTIVPAAPSFIVEPGEPVPQGIRTTATGTNFSLYSQNATAVTLLVFERHDSEAPLAEIPLTPDKHKTFYFWHAFVHGVRPGMAYAYRVDGPNDPASGQRFDPGKCLVDPYARGVSLARWDRAAAIGPGDNVARSVRNMVVDTTEPDGSAAPAPRRGMRETIIYELHVRGFTRSATSGCRYPGTFAGVIEKIPYLQALGITAVELMPVCAFDPAEVDRRDPQDGTPLSNYWGYSSVAFFAPHDGYCVAPDEGRQLEEFREMVGALHAAGIEVILDMVFNHTAEGDERGPTIGFRGIDNATYYMLEPDDPAHYSNFSGCGNTLNCNHPVVMKLILDCLRFWVVEMGVDGFRFDEGSILARGEDGRPLSRPPVIWAIELSDALFTRKIIAEAWDAAGLYQVGYFPGRRWAEWNGRFRDDVRRFVRGDRGVVGAVASRLAGSADIYQGHGRYPINSINFVTCHDGFTLNDLVSYNGKHNEANGEGNRDGINDNLSWNCGVEGETDDAAIEALRNRQVKNVAAILLLAQGVPMIAMGDEVRRTQHGNNNPYCQDGEDNWFDWTLVERHADVLRFFGHMIALRKRLPCLNRRFYFDGSVNGRGLKDLAWHGCDLDAPGFSDPNSGVLAFTLGGAGDDPDVHVMLNMEPGAVSFALPVLPGRPWRRAVDTFLASPDDVAEPGAEVPVTGDRYVVNGHSVVVLVAGAG